MSVLDVPVLFDVRGWPVRCVVRPRRRPCWSERHYTTPDGAALDPPAYLYLRPAGWAAEVCKLMAVGAARGPHSRVEALVEDWLRTVGVEVISASEAALRAEALGWDWWTRARPAGEGA